VQTLAKPLTGSRARPVDTRTGERSERPQKAKKAAIVQSNYIPWKGYFDLINMVDEFILLDDVQYTRRDWRNRNQIKTPHGLLWLTIPVDVKGKYTQKIKDTTISDPKWAHRHWQTIVSNYSKAKHFRSFRETLEGLFLAPGERFLSEVNFRFLTAISRALGIRARISQSMDYRVSEGKNERLIELCKQVGATEYLSGPSARGYIDEECFRANGIGVRFMDYGGYPVYDQLYPPFEHAVSFVDLLLNVGPEAPRFMKSF
jgi:hypothetical protein